MWAMLGARFFIFFEFGGRADGNVGQHKIACAVAGADTRLCIPVGHVVALQIGFFVMCERLGGLRGRE